MIGKGGREAGVLPRAVEAIFAELAQLWTARHGLT